MFSQRKTDNTIERRGWSLQVYNRIGILFLLLSVLTGCLAFWIMPWDKQLSDAARGLDLPGDVRKSIDLSEAFAHGSGCIVILGSILLAAVKRRRAMLLAILMTASSGLVANGVKAAFVRLRPHAVATSAGAVSGELAPQQPTRQVGRFEGSVASIEFLGQGSFWEARKRSFPSGHTATAWGLAIGLSLVFPRLTLVMIGLAALASFQRLFSGAHFPSDIFAGAAIAFSCCAAIMAWPASRRILEGNRQ